MSKRPEPCHEFRHVDGRKHACHCPARTAAAIGEPGAASARR